MTHYWKKTTLKYLLKMCVKNYMFTFLQRLTPNYLKYFQNSCFRRYSESQIFTEKTVWVLCHLDIFSVKKINIFNIKILKKLSNLKFHLFLYIWNNFCMNTFVFVQSFKNRISQKKNLVWFLVYGLQGLFLLQCKDAPVRTFKFKIYLKPKQTSVEIPRKTRNFGTINHFSKHIYPHGKIIILSKTVIGPSRQHL